MASHHPHPLLFVDGYNIIGAWPQLIKLRNRQGLEEARHYLIEILANYSAYKSFQTRIVFDAYAQKAPSLAETVTQHLSVHYTSFGQTADSYIEKWCAENRVQIRCSQQRLIVATSDRAQQLTVVGYGAEWMSANQLAQDVSLAVKGSRQHRKKSAQGASQKLMHALTPETQKALQKMRFGHLR
ncbi:MAG: NYN domain-containing protein [Leptolyngbyaceae cyanobacterium T60_A2020_046]|nr:NYN domain-containing protein [Leptolyngbyaceae cyanobacterium T60_A2020_046]